MYSLLKRVAGFHKHPGASAPPAGPSDASSNPDSAIDDSHVLDFEDAADGFETVTIRKLTYVEAVGGTPPKGTFKYADEYYSPYVAEDVAPTTTPVVVSAHHIPRNPAIESYELYGDRADGYLRRHGRGIKANTTKAAARRILST